MAKGVHSRASTRAIPDRDRLGGQKQVLVFVSLPGPTLGGPVLFEVFVEFLVGNDGVPGERLLGGLEAECPLQFLIADVRSILIGYASLNECLTGNGKCELPVL